MLTVTSYVTLMLNYHLIITSYPCSNSDLQHDNISYHSFNNEFIVLQCPSQTMWRNSRLVALNNTGKICKELHYAVMSIMFLLIDCSTVF